MWSMLDSQYDEKNNVQYKHRRQFQQVKPSFVGSDTPVARTKRLFPDKSAMARVNAGLKAKSSAPFATLNNAAPSDATPDTGRKRVEDCEPREDTKAILQHLFVHEDRENNGPVSSGRRAGDEKRRPAPWEILDAEKPRLKGGKPKQGNPGCAQALAQPEGNKAGGQVRRRHLRLQHDDW